MDIVIDKEFADLCRKLTAEEESLLESQLCEEGCRDALVIWAGHDILLDGHNRKRLCERNGLPFETKEVVLGNREQAIEWIITNQLGKRNVTEEEKSYLRGKRYKHEKKKHGAQEGNNSATKNKGDTVSHSNYTAERLGKEYGVSDKTIKRDAKFADALDRVAEVAPEAKETILSGQSKATRKQIQEVAEMPKEERQAAAQSLVEKRSTEKKDKLPSQPKKEANWPQMLKWSAKRKSVTKESVTEEFGCNMDDVRKKLATANQSIGYIVRDIGDGEYRIRRAAHFELDSVDGDLASSVKHIRQLAEQASELLHGTTSADWSYAEQLKFVSEILRVTKGFGNG